MAKGTCGPSFEARKKERAPQDDALRAAEWDARLYNIVLPTAVAPKALAMRSIDPEIENRTAVF
jgi:hypothetical protein